MQLQKIKDFERTNVILSSIPINKISPSPFQSRERFDIASIHSLSQSIKNNGLLQPIVVRQTSFGSYELVAGERRLRACKMIEMDRINALIINASNEQSAILCMVENVQREQLHFFEVAQGYKRLIKVHNMTQEQLAKELGIRQSTIANKIRLLRLSQSIKDEIIKNNLTERHARALLRLPDEESRKNILDTVIHKNMNVATADDLIHTYLIKTDGSDEPQETIAKIKRLYSDWRLLNNSIKSLIEKMRDGGSTVEYNVEDLGDKMQIVILMNKPGENLSN